MLIDLREVMVIRRANKNEIEIMYELRWKLLRKPWNQPKGSEKDDKEGDSIPFVILLDGKIVGTARFQNNDNAEGQIRYLAIEDEFQRKGLGSKLIKYIELFALEKGSKYIKINARKKTAGEFFKRLGYEIIGEGPFLFNEIEHYIMRKELKK